MLVIDDNAHVNARTNIFFLDIERACLKINVCDLNWIQQENQILISSCIPFTKTPAKKAEINVHEHLLHYFFYIGKLKKKLENGHWPFLPNELRRNLKGDCCFKGAFWFTQQSSTLQRIYVEIC